MTSPPSVVTDGQVKSLAVYVPDSRSRSATVTATWAFEYPSGRTNTVKTSARAVIAQIPEVPDAEVTISARIERRDGEAENLRVETDDIQMHTKGYLLNPEGSRTFTVAGTAVKENGGSRHTETVNVTLTLSVPPAK
jgi:hypothetical protein